LPAAVFAILDHMLT